MATDESEGSVNSRPIAPPVGQPHAALHHLEEQVLGRGVVAPVGERENAGDDREQRAEDREAADEDVHGHVGLRRPRALARRRLAWSAWRNSLILPSMRLASVWGVTPYGGMPRCSPTYLWQHARCNVQRILTRLV